MGLLLFRWAESRERNMCTVASSSRCVAEGVCVRCGACVMLSAQFARDVCDIFGGYENAQASANHELSSE